MKKENNKIIFVDEQGQQTELNILFTYKSEERNREYVIFYSDLNPDELIAGYLDENNEILDIEEDEEYDELDKVIESYFEDEENQ